MKGFLKIFLILLLIAVLVLECYFAFFKKETKKEETTTNKEEKEEIDTKHLIDIYTGYNADNLDLIENKESDKISYYTISGLKDKDIENKVNNRIKEKVEELKKSIKPGNYLNGYVESNFENTISMYFDSYDDDWYYYEYIGSLNFDLTTGNELSIMDVVNDKNALKNVMLKELYVSLSKTIGLSVPKEVYEPDYSEVEDEQLQIVRKFMNDDFFFWFDEGKITIEFKGVNIKYVSLCSENKPGAIKAKYESGYIYYEEGYKDNHSVTIRLRELINNLLIYNKFKTDYSIYEKESDVEPVKLEKANAWCAENDYVKDNNYFIDYSMLGCSPASKKAKETFIKEVLVKNDKYTIYDVYGKEEDLNSYTLYAYDVFQYDITKDIFDKYKKDIYIGKYDKISYDFFSKEYNHDYETDTYYNYEFLKDYLNKRRYFYYIFDSNGNPAELKNIVNREYLSSFIPEEWYSLGKYKNSGELIDSLVIVTNKNSNYPDNLVINIYDYSHILLKYKNKQVYDSNFYTALLFK